MSKPIKLSTSQINTLRGIKEGNALAQCYGRSQHGARGQVIMSLRKRGLVVSGSDGGVTITTLGVEWLALLDSIAGHRTKAARVGEQIAALERVEAAIQRLGEELIAEREAINAGKLVTASVKLREAMATLRQVRAYFD